MKTIEFALKNIFSFSTQILIKLYEIINWNYSKNFQMGFIVLVQRTRNFRAGFLTFWITFSGGYWFECLILTWYFTVQWNIHKCIWVCYCYPVGVCLVKLWVATCANSIETSRLLQPKYDIRDWWRREKHWFRIFFPPSVCFSLIDLVCVWILYFGNAF